jgi:hypothetical protein
VIRRRSNRHERAARRRPARITRRRAESDDERGRPADDDARDERPVGGGARPLELELARVLDRARDAGRVLVDHRVAQCHL